MIKIIDYGVGNIKAFVNLYKRLGIEIEIASNYRSLTNASKLILPGVGHFDYAMNKFNESGMIETVNNLVTKKKVPVLGICVGMQIMAMSSDEGTKKGLGWIDADVKKIDIRNNNFRLPHMGWNNIIINKNDDILKNLDNNSTFYFLHSYYFNCTNENNVVAFSNYGSNFPSIVRQENIIGIQCHPEKSHEFGEQILKNFFDLDA